MDNTNDKKMKKILLFIALTSYSFSQSEITSLSIDDAVEYGIENNRRLMNAEREIKMAYKERWKTIAIGLPNVTLDLNYLNYLELPTSLIPAEFFGGNSGEFAELSFGTKQTLDGSLTLRQLLFDGSYMIGLASIELFMDIAKKAKIKTDIEVKKATISAYGNALVSQERVEILKRNLENVKKNLKEIKYH